MFKFIINCIKNFIDSLEIKGASHSYTKLELEKNSNQQSRQDLNSLLRQK